ncbi:MAG: hypothetical protein ACKO9Z_07865 [Planctomycetota bacterium]
MDGHFLRIIASACFLALGPGSALAQQLLQQGFEGKSTLWVPVRPEPAPRDLEHRISDELAHSGQRSELVRFQAEAGVPIQYTYEVGKAPVVNELTVGVWIKSNRPGTQLVARVVLPLERDPRQLDRPLTLLVPGDTYQLAGRWQQLLLRQPPRKLREQLALVRDELKRDVNPQDAFVDRVLLTLGGGPGLTEVNIDDLEVGPLSESTPAPRPTVTNPGLPAAMAPRAIAGDVQVRGNNLMAGGQRFFMRGIRHSGAPLKTLRDAGFNTLWVEAGTAEGEVDEAVRQGFWLVPELGRTEAGQGTVPGRLTSMGSTVSQRVARFMDRETTLAWSLGDGLDMDSFSGVSSLARGVRTSDANRPIAVDVTDGFQKYAGGIDQPMLGAHRWPLYTGLELAQYRDWLLSRRNLAGPNAYTWTWIQTHLPRWHTVAAYSREPGEPFADPIGPQPEQIRLMAHIAIGSGMKGLAFWSDRFLSDTHSGRDRLLGLALLNMELQMLEPLLVTAEEPRWIETSHPDVQAAVLRCDKSLLVLPVWMGRGTQFVPGQSAIQALDITIPHAPIGTSAWEVSTGGVKSLPWNRIAGGMQVRLRDFHLTSAIVVSPDLGASGPIVRLQEMQKRNARAAAQWAQELSTETLQKVRKAASDLEQCGHGEVDTATLLARAEENLAKCATLRANGEHDNAHAEAERALRPLRLLMRLHWERALRELDTPLATPWSGSFFTLARHWQQMDHLRGLRLAKNVLPGGTFELPPEQEQKGWTLREDATADPVLATARRVSSAKPHEGSQCLMLKIEPKDAKNPPAALERAMVAVHTPDINLPAGMAVRCSAWVNIPKKITASADGAIFYDSAGGEPLATRLQSTSGWRQVTIYRTVPPSGKIHLTMALTGTGTAYFDDVKIEPLVDGANGAPDPEAQPNNP